MNPIKKCIRCMNSAAFCICPRDMTFSDKLVDVADRLLSERDKWFQTYHSFLSQYFMSDDNYEFKDEDNDQNV